MKTYDIDWVQLLLLAGILAAGMLGVALVVYIACRWALEDVEDRLVRLNAHMLDVEAKVNALLEEK